MDEEKLIELKTQHPNETIRTGKVSWLMLDLWDGISRMARPVDKASTVPLVPDRKEDLKSLQPFSKMDRQARNRMVQEICTGPSLVEVYNRYLKDLCWWAPMGPPGGYTISPPVDIGRCWHCDQGSVPTPVCMSPQWLGSRVPL